MTGCELERIEIEDEDGCPLLLSRLTEADFLLPHFPNALDVFQKFPTFEARENDVYICGYPKCGTHWIWEVISMLNNATCEYIPRLKESAMLEGMNVDLLKSLDSPRVLNTHLPWRLLPKDVRAKNGKIVLLVRKPQAVAVSMYHHIRNLENFYFYHGSWRAFLDLFLKGKVEYGSYFEYLKEWEEVMLNNPSTSIHVLHFEDMKKDPVKEIKRLSQFLEISVSFELIEAIAEKTSFANLKSGKAPFDDEREKNQWKNSKPMVYRKGEIDDWKNLFTVSEYENFVKYKQQALEEQVSFNEHLF